MSTTQQIIFEAMLAEAQSKVAKMVRKGTSRTEAASKVATDMDMTFAEAEALQQRVGEVPASEMPSPSELDPTSNMISFDSAEEMEQAAGILMYKGIPWQSKGKNPTFIHFEDKETLNKAHDALKRRWDFVEQADRTVAKIEFDNLGDYERVIEYMTKQGMLVEFGASEGELSEDIVDELKASQPVKKKGAKTKPITEDDIAVKDGAYDAVSKDKHKHDKINVWDNRSQRVAKARKRWK